MKVLFIDIDGVLNSDRYIKSQDTEGLIIDPSKMKILSSIVKKTDTLLILSSSWREHWEAEYDNCDHIGKELYRIFSEHDLFISDKTPSDCKEREEQIKRWLLNNPDVDSFAVLDDMFLSDSYLKGHFVRTSNINGGLSQKNADDCIKILNKKIPE